MLWTSPNCAINGHLNPRIGAFVIRRVICGNEIAIDERDIARRPGRPDIPPPACLCPNVASEPWVDAFWIASFQQIGHA